MSARVLIANRGEIALRLLRACRTLGLESVAIFTEFDRDLAHLKFADDQVKVRSYLDIDDVVMAGVTRGCNLVHPGYGLLAENALFAQKVLESGMSFVGPTPEHIALLGDKVEARRVFKRKAISPIPGSEGAVQTAAEVESLAVDIGFPLVIKAAFGGGGRGIRAVHDARDLEELLGLSRGEAEVSFGRDDIFVEKLIQAARHIEVQLLGDGQGNCVHLGTRDCSVQRKYQKLIEEAPAPGLDKSLLLALTSRCVAALSELKYKNAVTLEFLYTQGEFYFLEANTRLQVEHPVTEEITDLDVVAAQFYIAQHGKLPFSQEQIRIHGHAIELRVLAEDDQGQPSPGVIERLELPGGPGVRVDSHIYVGYRVPHQYDSLIAKVIVFGANRTTAIARAKQAMKEFKVQGVSTNVKSLLGVLEASDFTDLKIHTNWKPK